MGRGEGGVSPASDGIGRGRLASRAGVTQAAAVSAPTPYPPELVRWARDPSRRGGLEAASLGDRTLSGHARNRSCGDALEVRLWLDDDGRIVAARHDGEACALSLAAAAAVCADLEGQPLASLQARLAPLSEAVMTGHVAPDHPFAPFVAVHPLPARHRCVTLIAEAFLAASPGPTPPSDGAP